MVSVLAATDVAYELATSLAPLPKALKTKAIEVMARIQSYLAVTAGIAMVVIGTLGYGDGSVEGCLHMLVLTFCTHLQLYAYSEKHSKCTTYGAEELHAWSDHWTTFALGHGAFQCAFDH